VALAPAPAAAQYQAPSETLAMSAKAAVTWSVGGADVLQLDGPVTVAFDRATLTAQRAVVWLSPEAGNEPGRMRVQVVLVGDAKVVQQGAVRTGDRMLVNASVAGRVRLTADAREERDASASDLYRLAESIRNPQAPPPAAAPTTRPIAGTPFSPTPDVRPAAPDTQPLAGTQESGTSRPATTFVTRPTTAAATRGTTGPATAATGPAATGPATATAPFIPPAGETAPLPTAPVFFEAPEVTTVLTDDGTYAFSLSKGVKVFTKQANGNLIEMQGQRAVLFTNLRDLSAAARGGDQQAKLRESIVAAYVEGDARMTLLPADQQRLGEQRLEAARFYYEFASDRAVLTDVVLRTIEPKAQTPIIVHAKSMRQLATGEYRAEGAELSTSAFAVPTYSLRAETVYIRHDPAPDDATPARTTFEAKDATFRAFGVPFFYLPAVGGTFSDGQEIPLRSIGGGHSTSFGTEALTEWGLFETLGYPRPRDLDVSYRLDYYSDRGPAVGLAAKYQGGSVAGGTREPWSFEGGFRSFFVYDEGTDNIGRPVPGPPDGESRLRGEALWEHQHILPDDWQVQLRAGFVSDPTFLEQWFPREFDRELPHDVSAYVKRQRDTEAFTLLLQAQPNEQVTTSDLEQEQFEVEHLPEIGYHRIGDAVGPGTFYSDNLFSGLHFQRSRYSLAEQGFVGGLSPGLPSLGTTGVTDDQIWRADLRQEVDFPFSAGPFRVVPYVVGRYTGYTDSPEEGGVNRLFGGVGARITTAFWKVDDTVENRLLDIHRLRHVIEPEVNLFAAGTTVDRSQVYVFEEQNDPLNDVSAVQLALRQRWQTYRGGPGRWRSVDVLSLNVEANLFNNLPDGQVRRPVAFRGLYFPSLPETSVPRNAINADATWRIADTTALLADAQWNADHSRLATASVGLVVQRDERMTYYLGTRYIDELNSNITTFAIDYQISPRYNVGFAQSFDFSQGENVASGLSLIRKFDTLFMIFRIARNETLDQTSFGFSVVPRGLAAGIDTDTLSTALETNRR
ncbi:MAG: hypothetical protein JWO31_3049, partial [Phycisphaerales bacterium]|nr:hypothetical protein [Phycisphaerales bacterium]